MAEMRQVDIEKIFDSLRFRLAGGHGEIVNFDVCTPDDVALAVADALGDFLDAVERETVAGCGGQIDELGRLVAIAIKGIDGLVAMVQRQQGG